MKKLMSVRYSDLGFNFSMLVLRLSSGFLLMILHGIVKMQKFPDLQYKFGDPLHIGSTTSLILVIFAEVFCSAFVLLGLFTRLAVIPLLILTTVIIFIVQKGQPLKQHELAALFMTNNFILLLCGPGKYSLDGWLKK